MMGYMKTLSVAIIAKNEEALILRCLESVKGADEIIVVDTGSTDRTMAIAAEFGAKVYEFPWVDDFSAARNSALGHCTSDYVLSIDCDEVLEEGGIEKIRAAIELGHRTYAVSMTSEKEGQVHHAVRLFKRDPEIFWKGAAHEALTVLAEVKPAQDGIVITYGYSPAHTADPDRMLRVLQSAIQTDPSGRNYYYLAREFYYRRDYEKAIEIFALSIKLSSWMPEKADATLYIARCNWFLSRGDEARRMALEAVRWNPMFKEALLLLSELHDSPYKEKWAKLAEAADNSDLLFLRT